MTRRIETSGPLRATVHVPGSKSITNRGLVCAALARGESRLVNASSSDDSGLMANGLNQLGVLVRRTEEGMIVVGTGGTLYAPKYPIPVGNAGTTLRFLLSVSALAEGTTVLEGSGRMAERPNEELVAALRSLGVTVGHREGTSRFEVGGGSLEGGLVTIRSSGSSQFISSLLLVAPCARSGMTVRAAEGLSSASYVGLTVDVMRRFGVRVTQGDDLSFSVGGGEHYRRAELVVEPDASSASYPMAAAAIAGGEVFVPGVTEDSGQGDAGFAKVLRSMGCDVRGRDGGLSVVRTGALRGIEVDMNAMPDVVPTLLAVALFAEGTTVIRNVAHLRHKESDRAEGLAVELGRLGASVHVRDDGIIVHPVPLHGAILDTHDDHRLAMSFALIGLRVPGVEIENPDCVRKSFPGFWDEFDRMTRG